ncbi:MAG: phosphate ABC transporter permease subunit PstC [Gammaproteobacteria bacterium]|nr:phosphate ABC transporter permease subunit PstC [Gammaproteobacteria bacterium]
MQTGTLLIVLATLAALTYVGGRARALALVAGNPRQLYSLPVHYGVLAALWASLPAVALLLGWTGLEDRIVMGKVWTELPAQYQAMTSDERDLARAELLNVAAGVAPSSDPAITDGAARLVEMKARSKQLRGLLALAVGLLGAAIGIMVLRPNLSARTRVETVFRFFLMACASIAILTTVGIVLSVLFEALRFFQSVPITEFLFGLEWSPQTAIRADQVGSSGSFGAVPLFVGTLLISLIAMLVAVPIGLMSAIYLSEYAAPGVRSVAKPLLEVLAGIPTVVYGFFAALTVAPMLREWGSVLGLDVASESALAAGLVMGVMIIPFISSLSDDVINAVPQAMRDGAFALGATQSETVRNVVIPAALPGIVGGVLLGMSRAVGETMIVVMAAGLAANLTLNPLESVTTITVQIVTLLVGDQEFDSPKTLAAFALGLMLFVVTLILNIIALRIVRRYREIYE